MAIYNGTSGNDTYIGGNASDTIDGGAGNDVLSGGKGNDRLNGGSGADTLDGGAGNDVLVYRFGENAGWADVYSGGGGIDKLSLELTTAEWLLPVVQAEVARYVRHLATVPRSPKGEVSGGAANDFVFDFGSGTTLKVSMIESLEIRVDGVLIDYNAPTIHVADAEGAVTEDASAPLTDSGSISFYDINFGDTHAVTVTPVAGFNTLGGTMTAAVADAATGNGQGSVTWTYQVANAAAQYLAAGQTVTEKFNVRLTDSTGKQVTQTVVVTVTGTNDTVSITSAAQGGTVVEDAASTPSSTDSLNAAGTVAFTDVDLSDSHSASFLPAAGNATALGTFALAAVSEAANAANGSVGWTYSLDNAAAQYLAAGQTVSETYTVTVDDGQGSTASQDVVITVMGTNDVPVITAEDLAGAVTEPIVPAGDLSDSGNISFGDVDLTDVHLVPANGTPVGTTLGSLTAVKNTDTTGSGTGGQLTWTYTVAAADVAYLAAGQTLVESFTITLDDQNGGQISKQIDVTITGASQEAPIATPSLIATNVDQSIRGTLGASPSAGGDTLTFSIETAPQHGVLALATDGSYQYTPASGYSGTDGFTYQVTDGQGGTAMASGSIEVSGAGVAQLRYVGITPFDHQVSPPIVNSTQPPKVAAIAGGGHIVVWSALTGGSNPDGSGYGVYMQRYDASGARIGAPQQVNSTSGGDQMHASVAATGSGWVVAWTSDGQDGSGYGIYAQRYDASGAKAGDETLINQTTAGAQFAPTLSGLAGGGYVVSWTAQSPNGSYDVLARTYDASGLPQSDEFSVHGVTAGSQQAFGTNTENIAALADGRFVVVWSDANGLDGSGSGVFGRIFGADGVPTSAQFPVNATTAGDQQYASAATVGSGFVVTWSSLAQDGSGLGVYTQRYDASGNAQGGEFKVNTWTTGDQTYAKASQLSDGGFVVVWQSADVEKTGSWAISGQRYDANGNAIDGEFIVNSVGVLGFGGSNAFPSIALRANGSLVVAWQDGTTSAIEQKIVDDFGADTTPLDYQVSRPIVNNSQPPEVATLADGGHVVVWSALAGGSNPDGSGYGVYMQRYDAAGVALGAPQLVNSTPASDQLHASVAANGAGWIVTWTSNGQDGSGHGVFAQRYDGAGQKLGGEVQVNQTAANVQTQANVGELADGGYVVSWQGFNAATGGYDIYARVYSAAGVSQTGEFVANSGTAGEQYTQGNYTESVIGLDNGRFVLAWSDYGGLDGSAAGVFARVFDADGTAVADQFRVNSTTTGDQAYASVAAVGSGFVVTWMSPDGGGYGIYAQRYDADGAPLGGEFRVNSWYSSEQSYPKTVGLADGSFVVVWQSHWLEKANVWCISGQRYDAAGNAVGGEFLVNTVGALGFGGSNDFPSIALRADGALVVAWHDLASGSIEQRIVDDFATDTTPLDYQVSISLVDNSRPPEVATLADGGHVVVWTAISSANPDNSGFGVYLQRFDAAGVRIGTPQLVNTTTAYSQADAGVAAAGNGWVVTWDSVNAAGSSTGIFMQRYDGSGAKIGGEVLVNQATETTTLPNVSELANGGYVVSWRGWTLANNTYDVYARVYDANGTPMTNAFVANSTTPGNQNTQSTYTENVTGLADGRFVVAWEDSNGLDGSGYGIFARVFEADGTAVAPQFQVNTTTANTQNYVSVGAVGNGFVVTWMSAGQDGSGSGVYAQRFDANGVALGGEFQANTWIAADQNHSKVVGLADGGFIVAWQSYAADKPTSWSICGQRYDADGNPLAGEFIVNTFDVFGFGGNNNDYPSVALRADGSLVFAWVDHTTNMVEQRIVASVETAGAVAKNLVGGIGNDSFIGSALADTLAGGAGDDRIEGLAGNDLLTGGSGADTFVFGSSLGAGNVDTIADFTSGVDTLRLSNAGGSPFAALPDGPLADAAFDITGDGTAASAATRIVYDPATGALHFDPDGTGGAASVQIATLGGLPALVAGDVIVGA